MKRRFAIVLFALAALSAAGPAAAARSLQEAITKVERDTHGRVMSAETKHNGRSTVYRIKVLTREGQVRVVEVPADDERPSR
jgi:uncharacterized membrane protein YkoI